MPKTIRRTLRTVRSRSFDHARWSGYPPRADGIVIGTYSKSGTTRMQRIVSMLVLESAEPRPIGDLPPWPDMRLFEPVELELAKAEAQTHRLFFETPLPFDALPIYRGVKFIHVARDGCDAAMSLRNLLFNFTPATLAGLNAVSRVDPTFGGDYPAVPESNAEFFAACVASATSSPPVPSRRSSSSTVRQVSGP